MEAGGRAARGEGRRAAFSGASGLAAWDTGEDQAGVPVRASPGRASGASARVSAKVHHIRAARLFGERSGLLKRRWVDLMEVKGLGEELEEISSGGCEREGT